MRRRLFAYTIAMAAGIVTAHVFPLQICIPVVFGIACVVLWNCRIPFSKNVIILFLIGIFLMFAAQLQAGNQEPQLLEDAIITEYEKIEDDYYRFLLNSDGTKVLYSHYQHIDEPWSLIGSTVSIDTKVEEPRPAGNPRTFDYGLYLKSKGISFLTEGNGFRVLHGEKQLWYRIKGKVLEKRETFLSALHCSSENRAVMEGILFGNTSQLKEETYEDFRQNGTAHVLAVSGLHIGMIYGSYRALYSRCRYKMLSMCFLLFLLIYGTACLWSISVIRAVGLILLSVIGDLTERRYDMLCGLAAIAMISMICNPYVIFGSDFQMSFLAILSIIFLGPKMEQVLGKTKSFAMPMAVQMGLMPYMAYTFNQISVLSAFCNIPVVFLVSVLVPAGVTGFGVFFVTGGIVPGISLFCDAMASMIVKCNHMLAMGGLWSVDVVSPPLWMLVIFYGLGFYLLSEHFRIYFVRGHWKAVLPVLLVFLVALSVFSVTRTPFDEADMVFVDVGQGDCIHMKDHRGRNILIDGGGNINYNIGEKTLKPYLLKNKVEKIDLAAATHLHTDHYLGLEQLQECFPVKKLLITGKAGDRIVLSDELWIEVLWPMTENPDTDDENLNSLIFMIHNKGIRTLITGDITEEGEGLLLKEYQGTGKLEAEILKIPHHGSRYSSSDAFLDAVDPEIAVICVGENRYGHPADIVIEKLQKRGIMICRTDLDGAVGIINREGNISLCTQIKR